jgi:hypothetical protein
VKFATIFLTFSLVPSACFAMGGLQSPSVTHPRLEPSVEGKLDKRVADFRTSGRTLMATVVDIAYEFQVPLGIEYVDRDASTRPIDLQFQNQSLRSIFRAVVAQLPEYQVAFLGETVQIYSPRARADSSNLLNKVLKDFSVIAVDTGTAGIELTCALARQLTAGGSCGGSTPNGQWGPLKLTIHMQNAKVYEILNAIVAQNGRAVWTITVPPNELSKTSVANLWHIYSLDRPFREVVLDKLTTESLMQNAQEKTP